VIVHGLQLEAETAHLTHLDELKRKAKALQEATDALQAITQNKVMHAMTCLLPEEHKRHG
jgi:hypothetical protein